MIRRGAAAGHHRSPSSRRAWIEIKYTGSMYKEFMVALLAEGVDRNIVSQLYGEGRGASPSSRRAWIEIFAEARKERQSGGRPPRGGRG